VPTWFVNDLFSVLHRDAFQPATWTNTTSSLVERLWASATTPLNMSKVAVTWTAPLVVQRHVEYLRDAFPHVALSPTGPEWTPRDRAQTRSTP
jgi:hypothetical protein